MTGRGGGWVAAQLALAVVFLLLPFRRLRPWSVFSAPGLLLMAAGAALFASGVRALGRSITPLPVPPANSRLVTGGAYGLVRHPLYAGLLLAALGWSVAARDLPRLALCAALFVFFDRKARFEEKALLQRFPEYASYMSRVKRLIPWVY